MQNGKKKLRWNSKKPRFKWFLNHTLCLEFNYNHVLDTDSTFLCRSGWGSAGKVQFLSYGKDISSNPSHKLALSHLVECQMYFWNCNKRAKWSWRHDSVEALAAFAVDKDVNPSFYPILHIYRLITSNKSGHRGSDGIFWPLWALHTHAAQTCMQGKHP